MPGLRVTWTPSSEPDLDRYQVWRSFNAIANYATDPDNVTNNAILIGQPKGSILDDSGLQSGQVVFYYVRAVDIYGNEGTFVESGPHTVPDVPAGAQAEVPMFIRPDHPVAAGKIGAGKPFVWIQTELGTPADPKHQVYFEDGQ